MRGGWLGMPLTIMLQIHWHSLGVGLFGGLLCLCPPQTAHQSACRQPVQRLAKHHGSPLSSSISNRLLPRSQRSTATQRRATVRQLGGWGDRMGRFCVQSAHMTQAVEPCECHIKVSIGTDLPFQLQRPRTCASTASRPVSPRHHALVPCRQQLALHLVACHPGLARP